MHSYIYAFLALFTGMLVPLQVASNGQLGREVGSPFLASLFVFLIGSATMAVILMVARPEMPKFSELLAAPFSVWLGGFIAAFYIVAVVMVTPNLGVGLATILIIAGQILTALVLDHFGAFGNPQTPLTLTRIFGAGLMLFGIVVIRYL